ncbi:hypothetical protein ACFZDK_54860 [Streptomyces sp. NPDC007901]|uniref:hypothetical protein n=1 Tax=Streptomyces sp. NPDC007901 TaxID=3364785 RepID=UPI0036F02972
MTGWIAKGVSNAITTFFKSVIKFALNPLLNLLSNTLLSTPSPESMPRVGALWANSWQIALACYSLLVAVAGIVVMAHESVQTRYSVKEVAPRIPLGFLASALSLFLAGKAVDLANALSQAALSGGVNEDTAGPALRDFVLTTFDSSDGNIFTVLLWVVVICVLVALLLTFVVRVALTVMLIVAAPLALICHALPQTDGIARWWWKAFGGVLAVQVAQSLALITGIRVFLTPGGFGPNGLFGVTKNGLVNVLMTLALMYIAFKIPFWILGSLRISSGRSFAGSVVRAYATYRTFGLLRGVNAAGAASRRSGTRPALPAAGSGGAANSPRPLGPGPTPGGPSPRRNGGGPARPGLPGGGPRRPPGPPFFLQPIPMVPEHDQPIAPAGSPPPPPQFRAPGETPSGGALTRTAQPLPRPTRPPGLPRFQAPAGSQPTLPAGARGRPPAPARPRFQPPTPQPPTPPRHPTRPPAPAAFRPPVPDHRLPPTRHPRTSAPPPAVFSSPPPTSAPPARRTLPPRPGRGPRSGGDSS